MQKLTMAELKEVLENEIANTYCKSNYAVRWENDPYDYIEIYYLYLEEGTYIMAENIYNDEICHFPDVDSLLECLMECGQLYGCLRQD